MREEELNVDIETIQRLLIEVGYNLEITGINDTKTNYVVKAFQMHFLPQELGSSPSEKMIIYLENLIDKHYKYLPLLEQEEIKHSL